MYLSVWFRHLFRPSVTQVQVELTENGKVKDLNLYKDFHLQALANAIDDMWKVESKSPYWFETEFYEKGSCFQKRTLHMHVTCYAHDLTSNGFKRRFSIPMKQRKKFFDKRHPLTPEPLGFSTWPSLQVRFYLNK